MFSGIVDSYKSGTQYEKGKSPNLKKKDKQKQETPMKLTIIRNENLTGNACNLLISNDILEKKIDPFVAPKTRIEPNNKKNVEIMLNIEYFKAPSNDR
jgi:hypothetical protein